MIAHVVLLQPRADMTTQQRAEALDTIHQSAAGIPEIRRFRVGRRVTHGLPGYEQLMPQDFEYVLIVEFEDVQGLKRYLQAPAHEALAQLFYTATSAALAYDYEFDEPREPSA